MLVFFPSKIQKLPYLVSVSDVFLNNFICTTKHILTGLELSLMLWNYKPRPLRNSLKHAAAAPKDHTRLNSVTVPVCLHHCPPTQGMHRHYPAAPAHPQLLFHVLDNSGPITSLCGCRQQTSYHTWYSPILSLTASPTVPWTISLFIEFEAIWLKGILQNSLTVISDGDQMVVFFLYFMLFDSSFCFIICIYKTFSYLKVSSTQNASLAPKYFIMLRRDVIFDNHDTISKVTE